MHCKFKRATRLLVVYYVGYIFAVAGSGLLMLKDGMSMVSIYLGITYGALVIVLFSSLVTFILTYVRCTKLLKPEIIKQMNRYLFTLLVASMVGFGFMRPFGHGLSTLIASFTTHVGSYTIEAILNTIFLFGSGCVGGFLLKISPGNKWFKTPLDTTLVIGIILSYILAFFSIYSNLFAMTHPSPFALLSLGLFILYWNNKTTHATVNSPTQ